jgi:transposase
MARLDGHAYNRTAKLLSEGRLTKTEIAKAAGVSVSTVNRIKRRIVSELEAERNLGMNIVSARTHKRVWSLFEENPDYSDEEISQQVGVSARTVHDILNGRAERGDDVAKSGRYACREPLKCPECRRKVTRLPCVLCLTKSQMRTGKLKRLSTTEDDSGFAYKLEPDQEIRRRAVKCLHMLRMRQRKEPRPECEDAA